MSTSVEFNGESCVVKSNNVADLLVEFGLENKKVAVELNRKIIQRTSYNDTQIQAGDKIEIVSFVGGG